MMVSSASGPDPMVDLEKYRNSEQEKLRATDLLRLLPRGRHSVLEIGARDGLFSRLLTEYFETVTALDLEKPSFEYPRVTTVKGNATQLQFADSSFDCVFCTEVLEHIPALEDACREITRVARHEIIVGVPYKQDTRVGRTTCPRCGKSNPPYGHVNQFDENRLAKLFPQLTVRASSFVGSVRSATNPVSTKLMDIAGNPWGTYDQQECCIHCGHELTPPARHTLISRACSGMALRINRVQESFTKVHGNWIHVVLAKDGHP